MMEFSGEFTVDETPEELWKYFTDPDILKDCAPGCNKMELESPSHIVAGLEVGVGSVKPSFDVEAIVTECDRPNRLEIQASGEASRNSFDVVAWQELHGNGDGTTTVTWEADAEISGIIASMGERAIGSVADKLVNEFFRELEAHANAGTPAESKLLEATSEDVELAAETSAESTTGSTAAEGSLTEKAIGRALAMASGDGPENWQSFLAGVGVGLLGSELWHRLRDGSRQHVNARQVPSAGAAPPGEADTARTRPATTGDESPSLLLLGLTAALGAAGAIILREAQSKSTSHPVDDGPAPAVTDAAGSEPTERSNGSNEAETTVASDVESDNPLDRLESRP